MPFVDLPADAQLDAAAPTGSLVDLPQGAQLDPPQMPGMMRYPAMAGSALASGAAAGLGAIGDLDNFLHRQFTQGVFDPLHRLVMGRPATAALAASNAGTDPLSSTDLVSGLQSAGIANRPDLTPQNAGERYLTSIASGVGGMLPYLPLAGVNPASIARGLLQGAAAGAGGEFGAETFPDYPLAARAAGGIAGLYGGGKAFDLANRLAGAAIAPTSPLTDAYRNLGIDQTLGGDVTGEPLMQMMQAYASKSPGGVNRIHAASEHAIGQWGTALQDTADSYGQSATMQEAGKVLQDESRAWLGRWNQAQQAAEAAVSAKVPPTAPVDVSPVQQLLTQTANRMPGLPNVAAIHTNPVFERLRDALSQDAPNGVVPWSDMRAWRTAVGDQLEQSLLSRDGNQAAWRQLYGSLSHALGTTAAANGAGPEWFNANAVTHQGHQFVENTLSEFLDARSPKANTIAPEAAAKAAFAGARQGGSTLDAIRQEMPAAADELAAFKLRDMGAATPGSQNAAGTRVSPGSFVTQLSPRNLSPEATDALFGADPVLAQRVRDLARVGESMRNTERFMNTSNTASHLATGHAIGGVMAAPFATYEGYREGGVPGAIAGGAGAFLLPFVPSYAAARLATSPGLAGLLASPAAVSAPSGLLGSAALYPQLRGALGAGSP